ncbi:zinc finger protein 665 [Stomoxys calcitrans]|uniref:Protein krueppel n=1 Tax=Stomoxys calcitrans TaxID=35570 RepID=A0A1I8Q676_STOCA|nr:zinc finger protein 665 [Stomoxys calcitrans]
MKGEVSARACRICLTQNKKLRSLYKAADEDDEPPREMLLKIAGIAVEDMDKHEMLPKSICKNCEMTLSMAFEFREKALHSHQLIVTYMQDLKIPYPDVEEGNTLPDTEAQSHIVLTAELSKSQLNNTSLKVENTAKADHEVHIINAAEALDDNTIDMHLHELILPVKGETNDDEEYDEQNIEDLSPGPVYEDVEASTIEQHRHYDEVIGSMETVEAVQEMEENLLSSDERDNEPNEDMKQEEEEEDNSVQYIEGEEMPKSLAHSPATEGQSKNLKQNVESNVEIDIDLNSPQLDLKTLARRNRGCKQIPSKDPNKLLGYMCDICGNVYTKRGRMMEHRQRHDKEKRFECELCDMKFHMRELLRKHMYSHSGGKPLKCDYCSRTFYYQSVLKAHELVHKGIKPYVCDICDKAFSYGHSLKKHRLIHTEVKLYRCYYCKKDFRLQHHMKQHELTKSHKKAVQLADGAVAAAETAAALHQEEGQSQDTTDDVVVEEEEEGEDEEETV